MRSVAVIVSCVLPSSRLLIPKKNSPAENDQSTWSPMVSSIHTVEKPVRGHLSQTASSPAAKLPERQHTADIVDQDTPGTPPLTPFPRKKYSLVP